MEEVMGRVEYQAYHDEAQRLAKEEAEEERGAFFFAKMRLCAMKLVLTDG
jgi:hypothetical protein